ncbi:MAG: tetratricopeptide repeat protein [Cardiobacteriaceae bacterium]|nr:tetratricopeptide repeat protein [Cardiobacteriaceae bacterium]
MSSKLIKNKTIVLLISLTVLAACGDRERMLEEQINENKRTIQQLRNQVVDLQAENSGLNQQLTTAKQGRIPTGVIAVQSGDLYNRVQEGTAITAAGEGYQHALQLYRAGDLQNAESAFRQFLATNPQGEEAALANYWLGDAAYNRRAYDQAAGYLAMSLKISPQGEKSAVAMQKLVQSLKAAGRTEDARVLEQNGIAALQIDN